NDDAHEHVERVLDIVSLFNIPGVSHDVVMLHVFPITLTGAVKHGWTDFLQEPSIPGISLKRPLSKCTPPSNIAKQLEEIHNFKQEGDETLYQAWEQYNDLLYKCPTHDINSHQKWHDGTSSRNTEGSSNSKGISAIVNKLENLGQDMKKLKENVHSIQVGCQICGGAHLDKDFPLNKDCPLNKEVKSVEEVKYGEFSRPFPNNNKNDGRFNRGEYDQPSSGERRPSLTEIINKYMEEASKRHAEQEEWLKKFLPKYTNQPRSSRQNYPRTKEDEEIRMNPRCSALLQNHLPPKEQDLGSFILPCSIGKLDFNNALADIGASISVMPLSMYKRLGIGKLKPINMVIEMADNTKCTPKGIVENLLIKIDKFIFPVDFVILDMVEDLRMPIILGRPLLATAHAKVDIFRKSISLEVGNEKVIFKMRSSFTTTFESV
ncbi:hypothetical protein Tco_1462373, partial [Tanacetum coccineum]